MAVLFTNPVPTFLYNGSPVAGGKVAFYTATQTYSVYKDTYTTAAGSTANANPVVLDAEGKPDTPSNAIFLDGTYDIQILDSNDVVLHTINNVTSFTTTAASSSAYFESFSGTGAQTAFTTSEDLGTDEKAIYVFVDQGGGLGYDFQNPANYTINGTTLTFASAPASGTNNIYVTSPSTLVNAASASASAASSSASAAAASAAAASTSESNAATSESNAATSESNAATSESNASTSATLAQDWATKTDGQVAATDYSAKAWAIGGTGTTTNNAKYWSEQAESVALGDVIAVTEQGSTPSTPASGNMKLYAKTDSKFYFLNDVGGETELGAVDINGLSDTVITASDEIIFSDASDSNNNKKDTVQGILDLVSEDYILLETQTASTSSSIDFTSNIDTTYTSYAIKILDYIPSTSQSVYVRTGPSGGFDTSNYEWSTFQTSRGSGANDGGGSQTEVKLNNAAVDDILSAQLIFFNPANASTEMQMIFDIVNIISTGQGYRLIGLGNHSTAQAIDRIRIYPSTGTITSGTFKLYGIK